MAHLADIVKHFLAFWVGTVTTPSCSPNLSPPDNDLITKVKQLLHDDKFANREDILTFVWHNTAQMSISEGANGIHHFSHHWQ